MANDNIDKGAMNSLFLEHLNSEVSPVLVFDGATGTSLQNQGLTPKDFGGSDYEGCNEYLVRTCPTAVRSVHRQFLEAGCDVIETNTFGATSIVLAEYGLERYALDINKEAAIIAKTIASKFSTSEKPRFVAGSIGPTTKLPSLGHIQFDNLRDSFQEQAEGLLSGGVDLFIVETCQDVLQIKAALQGIEEAQNKLKHSVPIMVSVTMETTGTMLLGTDIAAVLTILKPFPISILGLNCATGPEQMKEHISYLSENSPFAISCIPNAGLPENVGGVAHYRLTPVELKMQLLNFIEDYGVKIIGGCCGTTPEHIRSLSDISNSISRESNTRSVILSQSKIINNNPSAASLYGSTPYKQDSSFLIIGERLNASGSKKARELLNNENWDGLVSLAKTQEKENAHILDVNVDYVGRDGVSDMKNLVSKLVTNVNIPLMLDSTEWQKMESGLKVGGGKYILNSTNYEDGDERFFKVLSLAKKFGAAVVVGTIDENGMARTAEQKVLIAKRAYEDATSFGIPGNEIFYDPLALPISTGIEEDRKNGLETINAIRIIRKELPETQILLGVSNISFGLSPAARITLNSVYLSDSCQAGMNAAIVSPAKILPLTKITVDHQKVCRDLIYDKRVFDNQNVCIYDPLTELTTLFQGVTTSDARKSNQSLTELPIDERLKQHIIDGERIGLQETLDLAMKDFPPLEIINKFLLEGMKVVGEYFASGQMQLPFVLQSAETMKAAVSHLEPFMDKIDGQKSSKGKFLIATVKGDVHDIGKNLVDIILTNNGYEVINLGIKQDVNAIIQAQQLHNADCIAMSGLLVKSTAFMKDNLSAFNNAQISIPVILGGAALTPKFVNNDCSSVYKGKVIYGKDAFTDLRFMDAYMKAKSELSWDDFKGFLKDTPDQIILGNPMTLNPLIETTKDLELMQSKSPENETSQENTSRSEVVVIEKSITPPFSGLKFLTSKNIEMKSILQYLDKNALFKGQWQMKKTKEQTSKAYEELLILKAEPVLKLWLEKIDEQKILAPSAVYGYFPCGSIGNELFIFDPDTYDQVGSFSFPRQKSGNRYCIADFYRPLINNKPNDFIPMQAVTMGHRASLYANELFSNDSYSDYLYFHGIAVQLAEALAEFIHASIREECGFSYCEPKLLKDILAQRYRGSRYSFGYPACPNVADSRLQLNLLNAQKIGLTIDESDQLFPEQSTTAIIALHSKARYFSA